jgi:hypothetical protein
MAKVLSFSTGLGIIGASIKPNLSLSWSKVTLYLLNRAWPNTKVSSDSEYTKTLINISQLPELSLRKVFIFTLRVVVPPARTTLRVPKAVCTAEHDFYLNVIFEIIGPDVVRYTSPPTILLNSL